MLGKPRGIHMSLMTAPRSNHIETNSCKSHLLSTILLHKQSWQHTSLQYP